MGGLEGSMSTEYMRDKLHKNQMIMPWGKSDTISTRDAAAMMQCDPKVVLALLDEGKLDGYRIRPHKRKSPWRVYRFSVERYISKILEASGLRSADAAAPGGATGNPKPTRR